MPHDNPSPDFKRLFEAAPGRALALLADPPRFTIIAATDAYLSAIGKQRSQLVGRGLFEAFGDEPGSPFNPLAAGAHGLRESLLRAIGGRVMDRLPPGASEPPPGARRWSAVNIPVPGERGAIVNVIHSLEHFPEDSHDAQSGAANDRLILEARVKERTEDLLRSNNELEQFAYIASHDLQTPLRHISSYVQLLTTKIRKSTVLDAKTEKWIAYILSGTQQMKSLISDLLAYSRVGRVDIAVEVIDTGSLIVNVADELREQLRSTNGELVRGELPLVRGIRSQISQLFQNLIENALKFKRAGVDPVVNISCDDVGEFWRFSVADNGIGIEAKYFERIFLMFHRLNSNSEYPGTGIGLAICKKIVEFHGGKLGLESTVGTGTTFSFTLPKRERISAPGVSDRAVLARVS